MLQRVSFPVADTDVPGILHLPNGETVGGVVEMGGGESDAGRLRPSAELSRARARILLLDAGRDEHIEPDAGERYAAVLRQAGVVHRRVTLEGADHLFSAPEHRQRMLTELTDRMRSALEG